MTDVIKQCARAIYDTELAQQKCKPISDDSWNRLWAAGALKRLYEPKARSCLAILAKPENISDDACDAALREHSLARDDLNRPWVRAMIAAAIGSLLK